MLSGNSIVLVREWVVVSATPITLPFGDMNAVLPSGLRLRLCAFGLFGDTTLVISSPVIGFTTYQKSFRSDPTYINLPSGEICGRSQQLPSYTLSQTFFSVVRYHAPRRPRVAT